MAQEQATEQNAHPYNGILARIKKDEEEIAQLESAQKVQEEIENPDLDENALGAEEKTFKKRYGDLRRYLNQKLQEAEQEKEELRQRLREVSSTKLELPKTEAELTEFATEYPDLFALIETAILRRVQETREEINASLEDINRERLVAARERAEAALLKEHPDATEIRADPRFHEWAEKQSLMIRNALYKNATDWQACSDALHLYKSYLAREDKVKQKTPASAAEGVKVRGSAPRGALDNAPRTTKKLWKESEIKALSSREAERLWPEIEAAIRAGEIEYDITGAAM